MKVVIQRVKYARLEIEKQLVSEISNGLLILLGVVAEDDETDLAYIVKKCCNLRIFDDEAGVMNKSVINVRGDIMLVSQFTLLASTKKGNRPSYIHAAPPRCLGADV